jgi:hypothetical protein
MIGFVPQPYIKAVEVLNVSTIDYTSNATFKSGNVINGVVPAGTTTVVHRNYEDGQAIMIDPVVSLTLQNGDGLTLSAELNDPVGF